MVGLGCSDDLVDGVPALDEVFEELFALRGVRRVGVIQPRGDEALHIHDDVSSHLMQARNGLRSAQRHGKREHHVFDHGGATFVANESSEQPVHRIPPVNAAPPCADRLHDSGAPG